MTESDLRTVCIWQEESQNIHDTLTFYPVIKNAKYGSKMSYKKQTLETLPDLD